MTKKILVLLFILPLLLSACGARQELALAPEMTSAPTSQPASTPIPTLSPKSEEPIDASAPTEPDTEPPVIIVNPYTFFFTDEAPSYFSVVTVTDNRDSTEDILLEIDKSEVKQTEIGDYSVVYTATDSSGNSSSAKAKLHFRQRKVSVEDLNSEACRILDKIIAPDMTTEQQAYAVFKYVYNNIVYKGNHYYNRPDLNVPVDKDHRELEAYRGMTLGYGNCFTYYATAYELLSHIEGIDILSCERVGHETNHYWLLVNMGSGWYNFDACSGSDMNTKVFMRTTEELREISDYYWKIDETRYPVLAIDPYEFQDETIKSQVMK